MSFHWKCEKLLSISFSLETRNNGINWTFMLSVFQWKKWLFRFCIIIFFISLEIWRHFPLSFPLEIFSLEVQWSFLLNVLPLEAWKVILNIPSNASNGRNRWVEVAFFPLQDAKNAEGATFESLLRGQQLRELVNPVKYTSLKCLAARTIQKHGIAYRDEVPRALYEFIECHWRETRALGREIPRRTTRGGQRRQTAVDAADGNSFPGNRCFLLTEEAHR